MQELSINKLSINNSDDAPHPPRCIAIQACCANPYCLITKQRIRETIEVLTATAEGAVIGYTVYRVFDNGTNILGPAGDAIVAIFAVSTGVAQLLFRIKPTQRVDFEFIANRGEYFRNAWGYTTLTIKKLHYHFVENYNVIHRAKNSLLGGLMGSKYLSDFVPRDWRNVLANTFITTALTGTHLATEIAHERGLLDTPRRKILRNGINIGFVFLMSLGVSDEIVALTRRFGTDIGMATRLAIYFGLGILTLMVYIGFNHLKTPNNSTGELISARILRSVIYGLVIAFFTIPFLLDLKSQITQSLDFTPLMLGLIFFASSVLGIGSGFMHYNNASDVKYNRELDEIMLDQIPEDTLRLTASLGRSRNILMPAPSVRSVNDDLEKIITDINTI